MRATITLGRIAGVRVGVHWSVLLIFALIAAGLAAERLPDAYPGRSWALYTLVGLVTAAVFFASLLAHELAHAVEARRRGVGVDDITLWLLGGATRLRAEAPDPGSELRIAGVGPLVSLVLGGLFAALTWLLDATSASGPLVEASAWLAAINILLGVFNAIPAAPLDGGRLLRAFLWWRTGDRLRAARGAAGAGRVFGWVLVALGLWGFLTTGVFGPLWLALVGWFLVLAATAEGRQARLRETVSGVPVSSAMTADPVTVPATLPADRLRDDPSFGDRHRAFPVTDEEGRAVGLVTREQAATGDTTVAEVMRPLSETRISHPDEPLSELLPRLEPDPENRVVVLDDNRPIGVLTPVDVQRAVQNLMTSHSGPH
ncbi:site-2 protease family protein [Streptomyces sp. NPDC049881]|uniref:site-2 protease family protein n=1 Tax=Streptomyces sp. NPDC049881 TaxID=3155778 RepID=UPI0034149CAF